VVVGLEVEDMLERINLGKMRRTKRKSGVTNKQKVVMNDAKAVGLSFGGQHYTPYTSLAMNEMAIYRMSRVQIMVLVGLLGILGIGLWWSWHFTLVALVSVITILYFIDLLFSLYLVARSFMKPVELQVGEAEISRRIDWPKYTVLCPLYQEWAVLPQFCKAMQLLDYPKDKLEVLLLLEEDDDVTRAHVAAMDLPDSISVVVVPDGRPKTKPKACNVGLELATGDYVVIFDAEDIPERDQLKKAVCAFDRLDEKVFCLQAKLHYYNISQNILTRLFTLEYSLWFDLVLTGLQLVNAPIPLGGTSNHFRANQLRELHGWDPFNVTEDADLGMRIAKLGYRTAILDSTTMEEANSRIGNWLRQRSRWIKGYAQTYLVHMRDVRSWRRSRSGTDILVFQLVMGGKVASMFINPILWGLTLAYFVFRPVVGGFIESMYVAPIYYAGLFSLVIGNFLYMYYYMVGAAKRGRWELVAFAFLVPVYWLAMSVAAYYAIYELIRRPHHWHKTTHGLHLSSWRSRRQAEKLVS
jgi:cellulose synthase/poly-beta-1,6-N-acetylglucosamine synthase-like glycosyltransferase